MERVEGGVFSAYGVVNDEGTNDGSYLEAAADAATSEAIVVPVLVETPGFRTELILANRGAAAALLELDYRESLSPAAGPGGRATVLLAPREQRIVADAFTWLRSLGIVAGPRGTAPRAGRLRVTGPPGATGLWAAARVVSPSPGGGAYGVFLPGARPAPVPGSEAWIAGLRSNGEARSNVAFVHAGPPGSGAVELEIRSGDWKGSVVAIEGILRQPAWKTTAPMLNAANCQ